MFWAAFCWNMRTILYDLDGDPNAKRGGVTARVILALLQEALPEILSEGMFFIQDNSPLHTARLVQEWLDQWCHEHSIEIIDWPPYSPDLNPIENLWKLLKNKIHEKAPHLGALKSNKDSMEELILVAKEAWLEILVDVFRSEVESMNRRLQAIIDASGYYTKY